MKIKYIGPFDAVEIPELARVAKRDAVLDFDDAPEAAKPLLLQEGNFEPADDEAAAFVAALADTSVEVPDDGLEDNTIDELRDIASVEGVDLTGLSLKNDLIAAIRTHRNDEEA
jgi:hypothetical protein